MEVWKNGSMKVKNTNTNYQHCTSILPFFHTSKLVFK